MYHYAAPYASYATHASSWFFLGPIIMTIFWVGVIALIIALVRRGRPHMGHHHDQPPHNALTILQERFAKGDITKEQFEDMKKTLSN